MSRITYILGCVFLVSLALATAGLADNAALNTLAATQKALNEAPSYRETITSVNGGQTTEVVLEHVSPDRWRIMPPEGPEIIMIGDDTYMKLGNTWQKAPAGVNFSAILQNAQQASQKDLSEDVVSVTQVGSQLLGKVPTVIYKVVSNIKGLKSTSKVWVGKDNLPYRIESTAEAPAQPAGKHAAGGEVTATIVFDYSADIKVEAPK